MPHRAVQTRIATPADVEVLAIIWNEINELGARAERAINPLTVADATQRFTEVVKRDDTDVIIACDDDEVAGLAIVRVVQPDPLSPTRLLQLSNIVVNSGHRRRGVGHALIAAAADYADERGLDHLSAGVYPSLREAGRFFVRLGFAPVAVQRVAAVTALQRRLAVGPGATVDERVRRRRLRPALPPPRRRAASRSAD